MSIVLFIHFTCIEGFFCLFAVIGYAIFRGSNSQKDRFRTDPNSDEFQGNGMVNNGESKLQGGVCSFHKLYFLYIFFKFESQSEK